MKNKVSVVVTCYNHEAYVEQCLRSIFEQTYKNIELIVFNDGSTDDSGLVIKKMLKLSPFEETHYFYNKNQGVVKIRNQALQKITGDYLLFVDSDDFLDIDYIEILLSELIDNQVDLVYSQLWDFQNNRKALREDLDFSLSKELEGNLINVSSLVKTEILASVNFDEKLATLEDYDFWLNLILCKKATPLFTRKTKLNYRFSDISRSDHDNFEKYYSSYFYILDKYLSKIPEDIVEALKANIKIWLSTSKHLEQEQQRFKADSEERIEKLLVENKNLKVQLDMIKISRSYRLGRFILSPIRFFIRKS